jgi:hypothetical protein
LSPNSRASGGTGSGTGSGSRGAWVRSPAVPGSYGTVRPRYARTSIPDRSSPSWVATHGCVRGGSMTTGDSITRPTTCLLAACPKYASGYRTRPDAGSRSLTALMQSHPVPRRASPTESMHW